MGLNLSCLGQAQHILELRPALESLGPYSLTSLPAAMKEASSACIIFMVSAACSWGAGSQGLAPTSWRLWCGRCPWAPSQRGGLGAQPAAEGAAAAAVIPGFTPPPGPRHSLQPDFQTTTWALPTPASFHGVLGKLMSLCLLWPTPAPEDPRPALDSMDPCVPMRSSSPEVGEGGGLIPCSNG